MPALLLLRRHTATIQTTAMPGDTARVHRYFNDTIKPKRTDSITATLQTASKDDHLHDFLGYKISEDARIGIWVSIFLAIAIPMFIFLFNRYLPKILRFISPSVILTAFSEEFVSKKKQYFIPNHIRIFDFHNSVITPASVAESNNSIQAFLKYVVPDEQFCYFLIAPTGVGKTTYLCNIFSEYRKLTAWKYTRHVVLLGKMYDKGTMAKINELITAGKAKNTILILDALDEYDAESNNLTLHEYKQRFITSWKQDRDAFSLFRKIIVSVREQFLDPADYENLKINSKRIQRIQLQPFDFVQIQQYVWKRFSGHDMAALEGMQALVTEAKSKDLEFIKLPLLLNYLPEITRGMKMTGKDFIYSNYNIYALIIDQWITREQEEREISLENLGANLHEFCENLAYSICLYGDDYRIKLEEFEKFEGTQKAVLITKGLSSRSLLVKESIIVTGKREKTETIYLKFAHNSFLEFFLGRFSEYRIAEKESGTSQELNIPFVRFPFALQIFIEHRWNKIKSDIPLQPVIYNNPENILPLEKLIEWNRFFDRLIVFEQAKAAFTDRMEVVLNSIEGEWKQRFGAVRNLVYDNSNFWDTPKKRPYPDAQKSASYLRPFIKKIVLETRNITDSHLECFHGIKSLTSLIIKNFRQKPGTGLKNLQVGPDNLQRLCLSHTNLSDEALTCFAGAKSINMLDLSYNKITGSGLQHFAGCSETLTELYLQKNKITDEHLVCFKNARNIKTLVLHNNKLNGTGFQYFEGCADALQHLNLWKNSINHENFAYFKHTSNLQILSLSYNKLSGRGLQHFAKNTRHLRVLQLSYNEIVDEHLIHFKEAKFIEILSLNDNRLTGSGLQHLTNCVPKLEKLYLSTNSITDEHLKYLNGAENLQVLSLSNNRLTGSGLQYFTAGANRLEELYLCDNNIQDEQLIHFNKAGNIKILSLHTNKLLGPGLQYFTCCANSLQKLYLHNNNITDEHLVYFKDACNIEILNLNNNRFTGPGLEYFAGCASKLIELGLAQNQLTDQFLHCFKEASNLKKLNLHANQLSGDGLRYFEASAPSLEELSVWKNNISDEHLIYFRDAKKLRVLNLSDNKLDGPGLQNFTGCTGRLQKLFLAGNRITDDHLIYFKKSNKDQKTFFAKQQVKRARLAALFCMCRYAARALSVTK